MQVNAVQVKNGKVEDVLNKLLKNKGVSYVIKDGIIYLKKKEITTTPSTQQPRQKRTYKGTLLDENKEPLIGATILVKGTNHRAVTDMDGNFTIETDEPAPVLQFTYLGYKTMDMAAKEGHNVNAQMLPDSQALKEVVVTALGIKREKKMLGYSVQDVKADALNTTGDPSVTGALDGKVAGLQMNGKKYDLNYLDLNSLMQGAQISFRLSEKPNLQRGILESDAPYSFSKFMK